MKVKVYVEGGGDQNLTLMQCRKAFHELFDPCCKPGLRPRFIACGGRSLAYADFCSAIKSNTVDYAILLVDSEEPIERGVDAWVHLKQRKGDGWDKPPGTDINQAQLMVQCMESWFLADKNVLIKYYGEGFLASKLPQTPDVEKVLKDSLCSALEHSTGRTQKGKYRKVRHGFAILSKLDFEKVCAHSPRAKAFRDHVLEKLDE